MSGLNTQVTLEKTHNYSATVIKFETLGYKYYSGSDYYNYDSKIINEDGNEIVFIEGALYNYINKTDEDTYQLFSYCYDFSSLPEVIWTNIYL